MHVCIWAMVAPNSARRRQISTMCFLFFPQGGLRVQLSFPPRRSSDLGRALQKFRTVFCPVCSPLSSTPRPRLGSATAGMSGVAERLHWRRCGPLGIGKDRFDLMMMHARLHLGHGCAELGATAPNLNNVLSFLPAGRAQSSALFPSTSLFRSRACAPEVSHGILSRLFAPVLNPPSSARVGDCWDVRRC